MEQRNEHNPDVLGKAILDYHRKSAPAKLWIHNTYGKKEEMPVPIYFRTPKKMPQLELTALEHCRGRVLDIGAGAGSHALLLQEKGLDVTALDISHSAVEVMKERGVRQALAGDIFSFRGGSFDTLLLLMNGVGLAGSLDGFRRFLHVAEELLAEGGQLLFDSSDVAYLYEGKERPKDRYYGEVDFQYGYKEEKTNWFTWLYVDQETLLRIAAEEGWQAKVLEEDEWGQYLVQLTRD